MPQASKNIFWLILSRGCALILLFLAYAKLFRYLGPFGSGQYQFVLSYITIFATVVDFGVLQFITKKISEDQANTKKYFFSFLNFQIFASIVLYSILLAVAYFKNFDRVIFQAIFVTGLGMVVNSLTFPFLAVLTVKQDLKKVALINFLNSLVNIIIIFLAIYLKKYIVFLSFIQLTFGLLDLAIYRVYVKNYLHDLKISKLFSEFNFSIIYEILKTSWPYGLVVGFSAIYNRIDVVLISHLLGFTQVGLYTSAYKFFDLLNFFPAAVSHVLFPIFSGLMVKNLLSEVRINLEKYLRLMILIALPMAVGGSFLAKPLIILIAGADFLEAVPVLSLIVWATAVLFLYIPLNALMLSQLTKTAMWVLGLNVFVNILGNLILLPRIGIIGAAIMTIFSEVLQGGFYFYFVKTQITNFNFFPMLSKPILACVFMATVLFFVKTWSLLAAIFFGASSYFLVLYFFNYFKKEDFFFLKNILKINNAK